MRLHRASARWLSGTWRLTWAVNHFSEGDVYRFWVGPVFAKLMLSRDVPLDASCGWPPLPEPLPPMPNPPPPRIE